MRRTLTYRFDRTQSMLLITYSTRGVLIRKQMTLTPQVERGRAQLLHAPQSTAHHNKVKAPLKAKGPV